MRVAGSGSVHFTWLILRQMAVLFLNSKVLTNRKKPLALVLLNMVLSKFNISEACFQAHKGPLHVSTVMGFWFSVVS